MPNYMVMIYEQANWQPTASELSGVLDGHTEFGDRHQAAIKGGEALAPASTATSVRPDGAGGFVVTDGPFAETKEQLGGYYVVAAADLDEVLAMAKQLPMPAGCGVEVRPIRVFD